MKYHLDQLIWYMMDNQVHSAPVLSRMQVENLHDGWAHAEEQKETWQAFGPSGRSYTTAHGTINEEDAAGTKQELLDTL